MRTGEQWNARHTPKWWNSPRSMALWAGERKKRGRSGGGGEVGRKRLRFEGPMIDSRFGHGEFVLLHIYEIFNSWQDNRLNGGVTVYNLKHRFDIIVTIWELFTNCTQYFESSERYFFFVCLKTAKIGQKLPGLMKTSLQEMKSSRAQTQ